MLKKMKNYFLSIHRDERGAMSVEKVLIIAVIALPILIVLAIFKTKIIGWFRTQETDLDTNHT